MWGSATFDPDREIPDLSGKTILITGGSSGLGLESVRQLARHGANVILAARNKSKSLAVIEQLKTEHSHAHISFLQLDLASFASVAAAAKTVLTENDRMDVLMNNGGIMAVPEGLTVEGYEIHFGTNHMGHALLTKLLMPLLLKTSDLPGADVRIVNLTSIAQEQLAPTAGFLPSEAKTTMPNRGTWERYGHSKLANVLFTKALSQRYPQLTCVAVHPGGVKTDLADTVSAIRTG
ncbi:putative oxido [Cyphellophora attinorum]|uniref:Putative oxido n=1 Tax=Cyphellophora attinorum TaxID=1664694 RepID=A0A0N1HD75_9EURO|nr:putative oxido [Phialophora attinorum]KPI42510.1 putative oxido [Phialophora attinorum]